ncbi:nucleotidyltransferase family protein [Parafrankia elaeagni]|uniref:nucleotidyltransferase family protein n=1 Tax=Parafrankia elaeagni TaxID=222534 RepID=UPI0003A2F1F9|nr:nucleotidyltransferase family protein [Parafrankia elaeagni]
MTPDSDRRRVVTMSELRRRRADVYAIARRYGVSNIRVFGSVARAEADNASDVDLLVDLAPGRGLFDLGGFISDTEATLNVHVDVTTVAGLRPRLRPRVLAEAVAL